MSFLFGQQKSLDRIPSDIQGLRGGVSDYFARQLEFLGGGEPSEFFVENILGPARGMFAQNRELALAQAKESSGNLTGSGFANAMGTTVNRSLAQEDWILAQMLNAERQMQMQGMLGFSTAGVGPPENVYQPGMLDYLFEGLGKAAPMIAGGGG